MSSLRQHPKDCEPQQKKLFSPKATVSQAFDVALKDTCNQAVRKRVSDFKSPGRRLASSYYRWHNQSGKNSLWSTEFECSLRKEDGSQGRYYSYVKPIVYKDVEKKIYNRKEMICDRHFRSFSLK